MGDLYISTRVGEDGKVTLQLPLEYAGCLIRFTLPDLSEIGTETPVITMTILKTREELAAMQAVSQTSAADSQGGKA